MPTKQAQLLHKRGPRAPDATEIDVGEVAINTAAGKLYVKTDGDDIVEIGTDGGSGGSAVTISETAPNGASAGDEWYCSAEGEGALYIFDGDVWFGVTAPSFLTISYAISALTRSGDVSLELIDDALPVYARGGAIDWNAEGDELVGNARSGEVNIPLQEQQQ
mgnify:CR=1 FL=1